MKPKIILHLIVLFYILTAAGYAQELVAGKDGSIRNVDTRALITDGGESYLATRNEIYRSADPKGRWESIFSLNSGQNEITSLGGSARTIFAGTRRGLFRSQDHGRTWRNVFRTIIPEKSRINSIAASMANSRKVIIGSEKGVYLSEDGGERWQDISANLKNSRVRYVALVDALMYACGDGGLYVRGKDLTAGWERIYVRSVVDTDGGGIPSDGSSDDAVEPEEADAGRDVSCIAYKGHRLFIGVGKKILYSDDLGKEWRTFTSEGLSGIVNYIKASSRSETLYCATTKGVFTLDEKPSEGRAIRWREIYKGTDRVFNANSIAYGDEEEKFLWALTDKGLYKLEWAPEATNQYIDVERNMKTLKITYDNEPSFKALQQAAMKFAEVDPDKIAKWRTQARMKALVPKFSVGLDHGNSSNAEIYTSATNKYVVVGPDDVNDGWDMSVSWDLAGIIWSDDQTNIDVRSRLTTQLRNDILDDLRRAYFERKRLQFEMISNPPQDPKLRFEKELRVQELTQAIDDLTGNYLSDRIKKEPPVKGIK